MRRTEWFARVGTVNVYAASADNDMPLTLYVRDA
jgi:hypothetical protein